MNIINLTVENVKRIKAARITPEGKLIQITGKNAQGKSSILDAIEMTLAGKSSACPKPIRSGARKARCVVELDGIKVTRRWTTKGSTLTVEDKTGTLASPQSVLDKLVGKLTFDPLAFMRMKTADQAKVLRDMSGLDTTEIDAAHARVFAERTDRSRRARDESARLAACGEDHDDTPKDRLDMSEIISEIEAADAAKREADQRGRDLEAFQRRQESDDTAVAEYREKISQLEGDIVERSKSIVKLNKTIKATKIPDAEALREKLAGAERLNGLYDDNARKVAIAETAQRLDNAVEDLTSKLDALADDKSAAIAAAVMPIDGLTIDDDGIVGFGGVPLEQASLAEQIRISAAMGLALNPKLRILLIRDGSLLDTDSLRLLGEFAEENDIQIWLERVAVDGDPVGVVIEDGEVVDAESAPTTEADDTESDLAAMSDAADAAEDEADAADAVADDLFDGKDS